MAWYIPVSWDLYLSEAREAVVESPLLCFSLLATLAVWVYYRHTVVHVPTLHVRQGSQVDSLVSGLQLLQEEYWPTFWCWEARLQTVMASLLRHTLPPIEYAREILTFSDGGQAVLDWKNDTKDPLQPTVLILPGITGSSQSEYVKTFVNVAIAQVGARCVVFNNRGRGGHHLKTPKTYCGSNSEDLAEVLAHLKSKYPSSEILGAGISLGGIIMGNYLADRGEEAAQYLKAAFIVSVCFDPPNGCKSLEQPGLNLMLNRHLAHCLVESIKDVRHHFEANYPLDLVFASKTIREFDSLFTTKMFGYKSVQDYYIAAKLTDRLNNIKVPLFALSAEDDPFQPGESLPLEAASRSSHVAILATKYGGHIGFMEGVFPTRYHYSDKVFSQYLGKVFQKEVKPLSCISN